MNGSRGRGDSLAWQQQHDFDLLRRHLLQRANANLSSSGSMQDDDAESAAGFFFERRTPDEFGNKSGDDAADLSSQSNLHRALSGLRVFFLDLPLSALFLVLLGTHFTRHLYSEYFVHITEAAGRTSSDERLLSEYTYYERACTVNDMSTHNLEDLVLANGTTPAEAVERMMTHGATVIPQVLQPSTVKALREFVDRRNAELTEDDAIIVSQGDKGTRLSFGIDATEDPIIPIALREIATNPLLHVMIEGLVGKDPAISEITAITARFGASHQVWHADVKPDGNAVKFARTYEHSYSMFVPLQDTTAAMGATELCPGTHYCANWLSNMCGKNGIQLNTASPDKVWHAGDAALLNQQVWHRGYKHSDPRSLDRIVFIVSFIGRSQPREDLRQLARGTYFHMKWNMWGHTWTDLLDAHRSMAKPFSILRSLGIWKPKNRNWGYDLVTSGMMRMANGQMGVHHEDLPLFVKGVDKFGIPKILQGPVLKTDKAWETYLRETLLKCITVLEVVNIFVMATYGLGILLLSFKTRKSKHLTRAFLGVLLTHILPAFCLRRIQTRIASSPWGQDVKRGRVLKEPFDSWAASVSDPLLSTGATTLPVKEDVLIGSRFDAKFLGAYDRWLDYHPGNVVFRSAVADFAPLVKSYGGLPEIFVQQLVDSIVETTKGRFLEQDWRNGQWKVMTVKESKEHVRIALNVASNKPLKSLHKSIALMLSKYRFGILVRSTILALDSQYDLIMWRNQLFGSAGKAKTATMPLSPTRMVFEVKSPLPIPPKPLIHTNLPYTPQHPRWMHPPLTLPSWATGDTVVVNYDGKGKFFRGSVGRIEGDQCDVFYEDGDSQTKIAVDLVQKFVPLEEGAAIQVNYDGTMYPAVVAEVMPSGYVNVRYADGSLEGSVEESRIERVDY